MKIRRHMLSTFAGLALLLLAASAAQAQATRTWVSGVGNDGDPCSRTAPCKTYAGALSKTAAGGEISTLDPGGFGTINTNKSIMIEGTKGQGYGSMLASGTTGVIVNDSLTGTPNTIVVTLRNLSINGAGPTIGSNGIRFVSGKALHVEDCQIINFRTGAGRGISVELTAAASQIMTVKDTLIKECSGEGIRVSNSAVGGTINVAIDNTRIDRCNIGVQGDATSATNIRNSFISFNTTAGVRLSAAASSINIENTFIQGSPADGVIATAGTIRLRGSHIANNGNGVECVGAGVIASYGDNALEGNGTLSTGCPTPLTALLKK